MTSSNGNIFRVTGHLCGEFTGEFHTQRPVTRSFDVFFDLRPNKRLSKQRWGWWFETPSRLLWRHNNGLVQCNNKVNIKVPSYWPIVRGITWLVDFPHNDHYFHTQRNINAENVSMPWRHRGVGLDTDRQQRCYYVNSKHKNDQWLNIVDITVVKTRLNI